MPEKFHSRAREVFPLYHALADVIGWHGADVLACESSDVLTAIGLAVRWDGATRLLVANVTPFEQDVVVSQLDGEVRLRRLNEATTAEAGANRKAFREHSESATAAGQLALALQPYEVVRIDPA